MEISQQLIKSCQAQNRAAQKELYLALLPYLRAVINRYLRDNSYEKDVLQESFVKVFRSISKYDPDKAPVKNWAARIVINTCINYNERIIGLPAEEFIAEAHESRISEEINVEEITDEKMLNVLKEMPKGYFEVFNLFVIDEYSHKEIAAILNIAEAVSRKKLSRAKNWLRKSGALAISR
ncbi:MAG: RNA polymerase sigma factor (sigma-70 family) [Saprospiraceae bacterium]|jgi:RNA polymerase sigma factor (sigma-70 family)